jgi:hypothetical protein
MSQTAVAVEPAEAYEGKVENSIMYPTTFVSFVASALIYFGKFVALKAATELTKGNQEIKLPAAATDVTGLLGAGVAIADVTKEPIADTYGGYVAKDSVPVMRKGRIWVVSEDAVDDLTKAVFVRWQVPGVTPPAASLGSFAATTSANHAQAPATYKWVAATTIGSVNYGLLEINLP